MDLESMVLSELNQSQKEKANNVLVHKVSKVDKFPKTENNIIATRARGEGEMGSCCLLGIEFQALQDEQKRSGDYFLQQCE